jgi:hypothetical protein
MKRALVCLVVGLLLVSGVGAQVGIRNISSMGIDTYFDGTLALDINQVALFGLTDRLSAEVRLQRQDTPVLHETTVSLAPVFIVGEHNYYIVRYGLGIGTGAEDSTSVSQSRTLSHDLTLDANYESARLYGNLAVTGSYYPDNDYWFVLPSVAARLPLTSRLNLLGRYFFSYNSEDAVSNALLVESGYRLAERFTIKAGATASLDLRRPAGRPDADRASEWEITGITGFSFQVRPTLALRYHLAYLGRLDRADGIRNILVLDASF